MPETDPNGDGSPPQPPDPEAARGAPLPDGGESAEPEAGDAADDGRDEAEEEAAHAVVLDYLPHGDPADDRPQYQKPALAHALGERAFRLYEFELVDDADVTIGDRLRATPELDERATRAREIDYEDLSNGARNELEYAVEEIIDADERRFVDFYNDAQPITLRLHQLNLLPGIGKKLRNNILDERKRGPFESFEDLSERVDGLHRPREVVAERILEELREEDLKYETFVGREPDD